MTPVADPRPSRFTLGGAVWLRSCANVVAAMAFVAYLAACVQADRRDHALCVAAMGLPCSALHVWKR